MTRRGCACGPELAELRASVVALDLSLREALSLLRRASAGPPAPAARTVADYSRVVDGLKAAVVALVPRDSAVLVVTRGDERLLDLDGRPAGHFPQSADGEYAGYHPRDSDAAIAELERLRSGHWRYLVFPSTALWWLDHYADLRRHLETTGRLLLHQNGLGVVYGLSPSLASTPLAPLEPVS